MSKDNDFEQAFSMGQDMPDFPDYEIVADTPTRPAATVKPEPETPPNLEQDMVEVKSRIDSFSEMLTFGEKFGLSDDQKKMIKEQLSELTLIYSKLEKTLNFDEPAPITKNEKVSAADDISENDLTELDRFTQRRKAETLKEVSPPEEVKPAKPTLLKDRIKKIKDTITTKEQTAEIKESKPSYLSDYENRVPETELNAKTNGRSRYMTSKELTDVFGDNYQHSKDNLENGKLVSRTHYFDDGLLVKETEDAIVMRGRRKANDIAVDLIEVAKNKGWNSIVLEKGNPLFIEHAYINAIKNGIRVEPTSLKQEEEFQSLHKAHNLDRYAKFGETKKEDVSKTEPMPEYQVKRGRGMKM